MDAEIFVEQPIDHMAADETGPSGDDRDFAHAHFVGDPISN
jgi:hypothetical protein